MPRPAFLRPAPLLPAEAGLAATGRPYGARSDEAVTAGDLLMRHVPALARGDLEIVAIARQLGVLTKVAVRRRPGVRLERRPISLVLGVGADYLHRVRAELGGEPIHVVQWQGDPRRYIADALGLSSVPPMLLLDASRRAQVLLGEIDYRGAWGRRASNVLVASALTGWRIRLKRIATSPAWRALDRAREEGRSVTAGVAARVPKGLAVVVFGLHGLLPTGQVRGVRRGLPAERVDALLRQRLGQELQVTVLRLDADMGHIFVSERVPAGRQLTLSLTFERQ